MIQICSCTISNCEQWRVSAVITQLLSWKITKIISHQHKGVWTPVKSLIISRNEFKTVIKSVFINKENDSHQSSSATVNPHAIITVWTLRVIEKPWLDTPPAFQQIIVNLRRLFISDFQPQVLHRSSSSLAPNGAHKRCARSPLLSHFRIIK